MCYAAGWRRQAGTVNEAEVKDWPDVLTASPPVVCPAWAVVGQLVGQADVLIVPLNQWHPGGPCTRRLALHPSPQSARAIAKALQRQALTVGARTGWSCSIFIRVSRGGAVGISTGYQAGNRQNSQSETKLCQLHCQRKSARVKAGNRAKGRGACVTRAGPVRGCVARVLLGLASGQGHSRCAGCRTLKGSAARCAKNATARAIGGLRARQD